MGLSRSAILTSRARGPSVGTLEPKLRHEAIGRSGTDFPHVAHADAHSLRGRISLLSGLPRAEGYGGWQ